MVCYVTQPDIFICITAVVSSKSSYIKFRCRGEVRQDGSVTVSSPGDMEFLYQLVSYSDGKSIQYSIITACFVAGCFLIIYLTIFLGFGVQYDKTCDQQPQTPTPSPNRLENTLKNMHYDQFGICDVILLQLIRLRGIFRGVLLCEDLHFDSCHIFTYLFW